MDVSPRQGAFPSEEESRNTLLAKKASRLASTECTFDWCNNANHYYTDRAMLAPSLTCRKDITLAAIREMAKDGYGESKIQNATNSCTA
ncbi:hypothetical protein ACTNCI_07350 [Mitsuokella jalaludinii]|uniref:hypothetical protein n=1 Tax=Mitsuokella jalaludinii TaxID=187979 RepID=UPI003F8BD2DB